MPVSQRFIDLLNAPAPVLRRLASELDLPVVREDQRWELARRLSQELSRRDLEEQAGDFLYAGSTSLSYYRFVDEDEEIGRDDTETIYPIRGVELDSDAIEEALIENSEGDPFSEVDRPDEITSIPKLVVARQREDGWLLSFAVTRRIGHVIHNFREEAVYQDDFFSAVLRPEAGNIEIRSSAARARTLARTWLSEFAAFFGCKPIPVAITRGDGNELHDRLDAKLDVYRGKKEEGTSVFDTLEVTKSEDVDDMLGEQEFEDATGDLQPVSLDLIFAPDGVDDPVRLHVSIRNGSLWIRTAVPEHVIQLVRDVLEQIKAARGGN